MKLEIRASEREFILIENLRSWDESSLSDSNKCNDIKTDFTINSVYFKLEKNADIEFSSWVNFRDELEAMHTTLSGEASFEVYGNIKIDIRYIALKQGRVSFSAFVETDGYQLKFEKNIDQTFLLPVLEDIRVICDYLEK